MFFDIDDILGSKKKPGATQAPQAPEPKAAQPAPPPAAAPEPPVDVPPVDVEPPKPAAKKGAAPRRGKPSGAAPAPAAPIKEPDLDPNDLPHLDGEPPEDSSSQPEAPSDTPDTPATPAPAVSPRKPGAKQPKANTKLGSKTSIQFSPEETGFDAITRNQMALYSQALQVCKNTKYSNGVVLHGIPVFYKNPPKTRSFSDAVKKTLSEEDYNDITTQKDGFVGLAASMEKPKAYKDDGTKLTQVEADASYNTFVNSWRFQQLFYPHTMLKKKNELKLGKGNDYYSFKKFRLVDFTLVTSRSGYPPYIYLNPNRDDKPPFDVETDEGIAPLYVEKFDKKNGSESDEGGESTPPTPPTPPMDLGGALDGALDGDSEPIPPTPAPKKPVSVTDLPPIVIPDVPEGMDEMTKNELIEEAEKIGIEADLVKNKSKKGIQEYILNWIASIRSHAVVRGQHVTPPAADKGKASVPPKVRKQREAKKVVDFTPPSEPEELDSTPTPPPVQPAPPVSSPVSIKNEEPLHRLLEEIDETRIDLRDKAAEKVLEAIVSKKGLTEEGLLRIVADMTPNRYLKDLLEVIIIRLNGASPGQVRQPLIDASKGFFHLR